MNEHPASSSDESNGEAPGLKELAMAAKGWDCNSHWIGEFQGTAYAGRTDEDGNRHEIAFVDTGLYDQPDHAMPLAAYIAAANPTAVLALIEERDALREALKESRSLFNLGYNVCNAEMQCDGTGKDESGVTAKEYAEAADRLIAKINSALTPN